ncbi:uncharacterized protein LOC143514493 [Brachyhypopomus gauderio]|uniref:uncharacterized protein LOC143514493 n=1 Tax=Brachyhypopomus gauderio TaxID=698409 RepID=UPI0040423221
MKTTSWLGYLVLFCLQIAADSCLTQCPYGLVLSGCRCQPCPSEHYFYVRGDDRRCDKCTSPCSGTENKVEVSPCTNTTNRVCHCKQGHRCPSPSKLDCRRECSPCSDGSFSNTPSLATHCKPYKDCRTLMLHVIAEGSSTRDRICGSPTTAHPNNHTSGGPDLPAAGAQNRSPNLISTQTELFKTSQTGNLSEGSTELEVQDQSAGLSTWVCLLLLALLFVLVLMCLPVWGKRNALKDKLDWPSLTFGKYHLSSVPVSAHPKLETLVPVCNEMDNERSQGTGSGSGSGSCPQKHQQVTLDSVTGVHNTVGSIFIYSPGMVVLGSNSNERKGEGEEEPLLMPTPQMESSCLPQEDSMGVAMQDSMGVAMQEEFVKELSFPVPATGK